MKKKFKRLLYVILSLVGLLAIAGLILAFLPTEWKVKNEGITPEQAATMRESFEGPHHVFTTSDGETLFLRRWNPDTLTDAKKNIAVLIFHGFTAYSGPYEMAGIPFSEGGYTTFGLDYRGHGLSGGNRGDSPGGADRWIWDLAEAVLQVKKLGFSQVVVMGHSLGVAAAMCAADTIPKEIAGLVLLSGAYEGRKGLSKPPTFFQQAKLISAYIFRPSYRAAEYYREGMTITEDSLFNFRYTPRFLLMMDVKKLRVRDDFDGPVLVGVGDKDELFAIDKVQEFYDLIPGNKKEFLIMQTATHAKIHSENWEEVVKWLDRTFVL